MNKINEPLFMDRKNLIDSLPFLSSRPKEGSLFFANVPFASYLVLYIFYMVRPPFRLIFILLIAAVVILILPGLLFLFPFRDTFPQCGVKDDPHHYAIQKEIIRRDSIQLAQDPKLKQGSTLFKESGCTSCHDPFTKKVGPPLAKISNRRKTQWIRKAIWKIDTLIQKNDKEAISITNEYGNMAHPDHLFLTKKDIDLIIYYLDHVKEERCLYEIID